MSKRISSGDVASNLRRQITSGTFLVNERLPAERAIAEQFGVSRGTVRDALHQLEHNGFVERRAGSGTYVCYSEANQSASILQSTSPLELVDARFALEPQIVRLAVLHATEHGLMQAETALLDMEACREQAQQFALADEAFHMSLAQCTQNSLLIWTAKRFNEVRSNKQWARMRETVLSAEAIRAYNRQHRLIFEAIRNRDAEAAATAMRAHLSAAKQSLIDAAA